MNLRPSQVLLSVFVCASFVGVAAHADTAIETETAQIGKQGELFYSASYESAKAKDGTSGGTLNQIEYGISDRSEILIEPFFYVWDHPDGESKVDGLGDLEITPSYMFVVEDHGLPAMLAAFKIKVPTGSKDAGSSGKYDYMPYIIFGEHYAGWTFNENLGVNFVTASDAGPSERTTTWCVEAEREFAEKLTVFIEYFSTEDHVKTVSTALEYQCTEPLYVFAAAGYTEDDESIFRLGVNLDYP